MAKRAVRQVIPKNRSPRRSMSRVPHRRQALLQHVILFALLVTAFGPSLGSTLAAPAKPAVDTAPRLQPDWMSPELATQLDGDYPVLVPSWVPGPFSGEPYSANQTGSEYRLYWLTTGGDPQFLEITGTVGGTIPDFSAYDRNVQLVINEVVRGYDAYRDLTPIYDWVWWEEGDVVYSVSSRGLSESDVLGVANGLAELVQPAPVAELYAPATIQSGTIGTIEAAGVSGATLTSSAGYFVETGEAQYPGAGGFGVQWVAPQVTTDTVVTFSLLSGTDGSVLTTTETTVIGVPPPPTYDIVCPGTVIAGTDVEITVYGSGSIVVDAPAGSWPVSSPNTDYDPGTDGSQLSFDLPVSGAATLVWRAPSTAGTVYLRVSGMSGITAAECSVTVQPGTAPSEPQPTATTPSGTAPATATPRTPTPAATTGPRTPTATAQSATVTPTRDLGTGDDPSDPSPTNQTTPQATVSSGDAFNPDGPASITDGSDTDDNASSSTRDPAIIYPRSDGTDGPRDPEYWGQPLPGQATPRPGDGFGLPSGPTPSLLPTQDPPIALTPTNAPFPDAPVTREPMIDPAPAGATQFPTTTTSQPAAAAASTSTPRPPAPTATVLPILAPPDLPTATPQTQTVDVSTTSTTPLRASWQSPEDRPAPLPPAPATATAQPSPTATATLTTSGPPPALATATPTAAASATSTSTVTPQATATATPQPTATATVTATSTPASTSTSTPTPTSTATTVPTSTPTAPAPATATPVPPEAVSVALGPDGGQIVHASGATLDVPTGAFSEDVTVTMALVSDSRLPASSEAELIPGTAYDITVVTTDQTPINTFARPAQLFLPIAERNWREGMLVFWVDGQELSRMDKSSIAPSGVTVDLDHLSRFVAGVVIEDDPALGTLPWLVAAAAALSGLIIVGTLAGNARRTRPHAARPRVRV